MTETHLKTLSVLSLAALLAPAAFAAPADGNWSADPRMPVNGDIPKIVACFSAQK